MPLCVVEGFCCKDFFQPFVENAFAAVITFHKEDCLHIHHANVVTAVDTVGRIVLLSLSELQQHVIFVSSNPKNYCHLFFFVTSLL